MNYCERSIYVACLAILLLPGAGYAEESAFIVKQEGDRITPTRASDNVTLVTQHAGAEMRPYLHPILAPNGKGELTEFSPGHHKHQTGLYWGFTRVNGRDYFHNNKGDSWLRKDMRILETQGSQAKWQVVYDMLGPDKKTVLTETQTWTLTDQGAQYTLDLEWQGLAVVDVTFGKYAYGGLFLRMPWTDKSGGEAINSEGLANGKAEGAKARWVDVGMPIEGRDDWGHLIIDWYDRDICGNALFSALTGRIYRFTYGDVKSPVGMNLALLSDEELVKLHLHPNDWYGRQARRILHERAAAGKLDVKTPAALTKLLDEHPETPRKLRALWTLHVTGGLKSDKLLQLLKHEDEYLRAWAIQLLVEDQNLSDEAPVQFATMAKTDVSPVVRLYLASALQRMPVAQRWEIVTALLDHAEDAGDHNLPLMYWYGFEPLVPADPARALAVAAAGKFTVVREHAGRRLAENDSEPNLAPLVQVIANFTDSHVRRDLLKGALDGLRGRKSLSSPEGWPELYPQLTKDANVFPHARALAVLFGDVQVLESYRKQLLSKTEPVTQRLEALAILVEKRVPDLAPTLHQLVDDPAICRAAIRALAVYADEQTPAVLLKRYADLKPEEKQDVIATLAGRKSYALALLDGVENKIVASGDIPAFIARQLYSLGDKQVSERLKLVWGDVRESSQEKQEQMARIKKMLTPGVMSRANLANGRVLFSKTCQQCHMLYGEGAKVGPDLTGSNRADLNYILANIIEPSAEIGRDYKMTLILTTDGRTISGQIVEQTDTRLVMHTATEKGIVISRTDIEEIRESPLSMMPEGQLDKMKPDEIRDLVGYLASKKQVSPSSSPNQSRAGNQMGSIQDDNFSTFAVTYNGTAAEKDWFAISLSGAVTISNVVFGHGKNFHDGGWFDSSAGKPIVQVQPTRDGVWETVGELSDYPKTTVANNGGLKPGQKFICELKKPVKGIAVRVIGVPSSGDNPTQAFSSCSELQAH